MAHVIASTVGLLAWQTLFNNFAVEMAGLQGNHVGVIQSVREIPGFLALLVVFVLKILREHRLASLAIVFLGVGLAITGLLPSYGGLMFTTLVMSLGFHYFETANQSLTLQHFDTRTSPWVFGKQRSLAAISSIVSGGLIYFFASWMAYWQIYLFMGASIAVLGVWGVSRRPDHKDTVPQRKELVFKKQYGLFYFLTFMAGARRQIFIAFAVFLLVSKFGYTIREITILFVVNNLINFMISPLIGKGIIRFGERKILSLEYASLVVVFLAYAFTQSKLLAGGLYILDHIFFNFAIAIRTYFQKIGDAGDIAPTMAVGFTINHIAAVFLPALGGMLWMVDYRIPFIGGAVLSVISLTAVQWIPGYDANGKPD